MNIPVGTVIILAAFSLVVCPVRGADQTAEKPPAETPARTNSVDAAIVKELKQAVEFCKLRTEEKWNDPVLKKQFEEQVRKVAGHFQTVPVCLKSGSNHFVRVTLNRAGTGFDGICFKVPEDSGPRELVWMFAWARTAKFHWYNLAREGDMGGFMQMYSDLKRVVEETAPWNRLKEDYHVVLQPLGGSQFKPGKEYLIWFHIQDDKPLEMFVGVNLRPAGEPGDQPADYLKVMGFYEY